MSKKEVVDQLQRLIHRLLPAHHLVDELTSYQDTFSRLFERKATIMHEAAKVNRAYQEMRDLMWKSIGPFAV